LNEQAEWVAVLKLSTMWSFESIRFLAIAKLDRMITHLDRLIISRAYNVQEWVDLALKEICKRDKPFSLHEIRRMAYIDIALVAFIHSINPHEIIDLSGEIAAWRQDALEEAGQDDAALLMADIAYAAQPSPSVRVPAAAEQNPDPPLRTPPRMRPATTWERPFLPSPLPDPSISNFSCAPMVGTQISRSHSSGTHTRTPSPKPLSSMSPPKPPLPPIVNNDGIDRSPPGSCAIHGAAPPRERGSDSSKSFGGFGSWGTFEPRVIDGITTPESSPALSRARTPVGCTGGQGDEKKEGDLEEDERWNKGKTNKPVAKYGSGGMRGGKEKKAKKMVSSGWGDLTSQATDAGSGRF
jgi:hypothetical protein